METSTLTVYAPLGFKALGDLGYVNELFCRALPDPLMTQLLQMAPPSMDAGSNEPTMDEQAQHWTQMYSVQLFQYDWYLPTMLVMDGTQHDVMMTNVEFSLDILDNASIIHKTSQMRNSSICCTSK